jgi:signal transduction histidine kinase
MNVVHNAIEYAKANVALIVRIESGEIVLRVIDDGVGMGGMDVPSLTERHVRGERDDDRQRAGMGLGLPIAKAVVEQHGGRLVLEHTDEGGARVELWLPIAAERRATEGGADEPRTEAAAAHSDKRMMG